MSAAREAKEGTRAPRALGGAEGKQRGARRKQGEGSAKRGRGRAAPLIQTARSAYHRRRARSARARPRGARKTRGTDAARKITAETAREVGDGTPPAPQRAPHNLRRRTTNTRPPAPPQERGRGGQERACRATRGGRGGKSRKRACARRGLSPAPPANVETGATAKGGQTRRAANARTKDANKARHGRRAAQRKLRKRPISAILPVTIVADVGNEQKWREMRNNRCVNVPKI